jgi:hypothetical protein
MPGFLSSLALFETNNLSRRCKTRLGVSRLAVCLVIPLTLNKLSDQGGDNSFPVSSGMVLIMDF